MEVTIVITSCNRPDLLERTIESFLKHNTYPIKEWIISEDSGINTVNAELEKKYPEFIWIKGCRGQIKSIDEAYSIVKTEYVFHLEDDWETYKDGAILESVKILEQYKNVSAVMCRKHDTRVYHMSENPPILKCWGDWGYYSFNPGLRRMSDYKKLFNSCFFNFTNSTSGLQSEHKINILFRDNGYSMALTPDPKGYIEHIGDGRHVSKQYKLGLCMIVKDESHIIHEALSCTLPLIDTYCIVDTGSTDNTIEKIKDFYSDKGISGEVHQSTWKDFGTNRSEALKLCDGKMDYILVIDADDLMSFPKNGKEIINNLIYQNKPNSLTITIRQGDLRYNRGQIFKADDGWKYVGVLHEFPSNSKSSNKTIKLPEEFFMNSRRLGGRNLKDGKMARDIEVLTKGLENEPDNERYMFYLAQSYRDNNNPEMAIKYYKQRFNIGRWHEEAWFSAYQVGECYYRMGNMLKFEYWMQKAFYFRPCRAEPIYKLYKHFKSSGHFFKAHQYYVIGYQIPFPTNDVLFIEKNVYGGFNDKTQYKINEENLTVEIKPNIKIYIVSCKIDRAQRLIKKAEVLNLNFEIIDSPFHTDEEVQLRGKECFENKTAYPGGFAATLGHLRAMKRFLETDDNHCMIVEDDVRFHKNFNDIMPYIKDYMERTDVNVFSLGFVNIPNINKKSSTLTLANRLVLENVPISNPWGCQCYMISRSHAKKLVEYFSVYNIYEVYKKFFVTDTVFYDNELGCKRSTLAIPIVAEDLSEETLAGNNNKPKLFDTGILDINDFYF